MVDVSSPEVLNFNIQRYKNEQKNVTNNKQEQKLLIIEIADASGHQTLMLTLRKLSNRTTNGYLLTTR